MKRVKNLKKKQKYEIYFKESNLSVEVSYQISVKIKNKLIWKRIKKTFILIKLTKKK